ncbi:DUF2515 family protein [Caballeronia sp. S22]|uniref:DUF2515 family protein n=1 Tax=Caballeronia sp. S22 TaxID=3137182 RepID=UPI003530BFC7
MTPNLTVTGKTNAEPNTCVDAQCSCDIIWSLAQQFTMRQLVTHAPTHKHMPDYREGDPHVSNKQLEKETPEFVSNYELRARRIAAAYARVFLEDFHLGDTNKIGRFYWLGLGAFASKQVAATFHQWQVKYLVRRSDLFEYLGRGNLWLFNDVLPWFYAYAAGSFEACAASRNSENFVDQVKTNFTRQKGHAESIDKIPYVIDGKTGEKKAKLGYLKQTPIVKKGFDEVAAWETAREAKKPRLAFSHLLSIAQHEQGEVLQGLIYDDPKFEWWLKGQRGTLALSDDTAIRNSIKISAEMMKYGISAEGADTALVPVIRALMPNLQLVLTSEYETDDINFRSDAPDRMVLEDYQQRMSWIVGAATKYHGLMQNQTEKMITYLSAIRSWGDETDTP